MHNNELVKTIRQVFDYVKNLFFNKCGCILLHQRVKVSNVMLLLGCRHNFVVFEIMIFGHMGPFWDKGPFLNMFQ